MATTDSPAGARNTDYAQALALAGLLAGASLSLARLYVGNKWWLPTWLTMASALGLAALLRRLGVGQLLSLVAMVVGFVVVAGILLFPTTLLVVVPTGATLQAMLRATSIALEGVRDKAAPVEVTGEFLLLTCAGAWAVTTAADGLAFRARQPLLALVPALGLFVFPAVVRPSSPAWYTTWFLIGAAGLLLFEGRARLATWGRWVSHSRSRPGSGWRLPVTPAASTGRWLALGASLLALGVPWLLPGYGQRPVLDFRSSVGSDAGVGLPALVSLRTRLRSTEDVPVFTVKSSQATYWRWAVLDHFTGVDFQANQQDMLQSLAPFRGDTGEQAPGLKPAELTQEFEIQQLGSVYLPAAITPVSVSAGRTRQVYQSLRYRTVSIKQRVRPGFRYRVVSRVVTPQAQDLAGPVDYRDEASRHPELRASLELGNGLDSDVRNLADQLVDGKDTPFEKALAIEDYLTNPDVFRYSLDVPALNSGGSQLRKFLTQVRAGYCEQFAVAMAVMARAVGVPARVAVGFTPGTAVGDNVFQVTTHDAHAWPELWFPRAGWVRFEPTPRGDGQTFLPPYATPAGRRVPTATPTPSPGGPTGTTVPGNTVNPRLPQEPDVSNDPALLGGQRDRAAELRRRGVLAALALLLLLGAVPAVKGMRNLVARRRAATRPRDAVAASYAEVTGWAGDAGIGRRSAETPGAYAARLRGDFADDAAPIAELTRLFERAEYAPGEPGVQEAHQARRLARTARAGLAGRLGWRRRLLAALSPRSLLAPRPAFRR